MAEPGWFDVAGGKLTTYRLMAEQTVDQPGRAAPGRQPAASPGRPSARCRRARSAACCRRRSSGTVVAECCRAASGRSTSTTSCCGRTSWHYYHANQGEVAERPCAGWPSRSAGTRIASTPNSSVTESERANDLGSARQALKFISTVISHKFSPRADASYNAAPTIHNEVAMRFVLPLLLLLVAQATLARDIFVNNLNGDDTLTGRSPISIGRESGPVQTIAKAMRLAQPGDRVVLAKTAEPYREQITIQGGPRRRLRREPALHARWRRGGDRWHSARARRALAVGRRRRVSLRADSQEPPSAVSR